MNELVMMEAALFQVRAAAGDEPENLPIRLAADVLANAVAATRASGVNPARVQDIDFALNDLAAAVEETSDEAMHAAVALLRADMERIRVTNSLSDEIVAAVRALQEKLRSRAHAMERAQYRAEGTPEAPLPHPPEELRDEAIPLARHLAAAGFETPALASLIAEPEALRYHTINEIADELDVIAG